MSEFEFPSLERALAIVHVYFGKYFVEPIIQPLFGIVHTIGIAQAYLHKVAVVFFIQIPLRFSLLLPATLYDFYVAIR